MFRVKWLILPKKLSRTRTLVRLFPEFGALVSIDQDVWTIARTGEVDLSRLETCIDSNASMLLSQCNGLLFGFRSANTYTCRVTTTVVGARYRDGARSSAKIPPVDARQGPRAPPVAAYRDS